MYRYPILLIRGYYKVRNAYQILVYVQQIKSTKKQIKIPIRQIIHFIAIQYLSNLAGKRKAPS